jgi:hypothetical protein
VADVRMILLTLPFEFFNVTPPEEEVELTLNSAKGLFNVAFMGNVLLSNWIPCGRLMGLPSGINPPEDR